jgi:hypothetical protein
MAIAELTPAPAHQPDISYAPSRSLYEARTKHRIETDASTKRGLPAGFPSQLYSDLVWEGSELAKTYDWNFVLTEEHVQELEDALAHFKCMPVRLYPD